MATTAGFCFICKGVGNKQCELCGKLICAKHFAGGWCADCRKKM